MVKSLEALAEANWTGVTNARYSAKVVSEVWEGGYESAKGLAFLSSTRYLEKYLWPHYGPRRASDHHAFSIYKAVLYELASQSELTVWRIFEERHPPTHFNHLFLKAFEYARNEKTEIDIRVLCTRFMSACFTALSYPAVRAATKDCFTIGMWGTLSGWERAEALSMHRKLPRIWRRWEKRLMEKKGKKELLLKSAVIPEIALLAAKLALEDINSERARLLRYYTDLLAGLLSTLATRRYVVRVVVHSALIPRLRSLVLSDELRWSSDLVTARERLTELLLYPVDEFAGTELGAAELETQFFEKVEMLQKALYKYHPAADEELLLSSAVIFGDDKSRLRRYFCDLGEENRLSLAARLAIVPQHSNMELDDPLFQELIEANGGENYGADEGRFTSPELWWPELVAEALLFHLTRRFPHVHKTSQQAGVCAEAGVAVLAQNEALTDIDAMDVMEIVQPCQLQFLSVGDFLLHHQKLLKEDIVSSVRTRLESSILSTRPSIGPIAGQRHFERWNAVVGLVSSLSHLENMRPSISTDQREIMLSLSMEVKKGSKMWREAHKSDYVALYGVKKSENGLDKISCLVLGEIVENPLNSTADEIHMEDESAMDVDGRSTQGGTVRRQMSLKTEDTRLLEVSDSLLKSLDFALLIPCSSMTAKCQADAVQTVFSDKVELDPEIGDILIGYQATESDVDAGKAQTIAIDDDIQENLKAEQLDAVTRGCLEPFSIVTGPPGSGKTEICSRIAARLLSPDIDERVLLVAKSHSGLQILVQKLLGLGIHESRILELSCSNVGVRTVVHEMLGDSGFAFTPEGRIKFYDRLAVLLLSFFASVVDVMGDDAGYATSCTSCKNYYEGRLLSVLDKENLSDSQLGHLETLVSETLSSNLVSHEIDTSSASLSEQVKVIVDHLEVLRAREVLRDEQEFADFLCSTHSQAILMTADYISSQFERLLRIGFNVDNLVVDEAGVLNEIESTLPLYLSNRISHSGMIEGCRKGHIVICGDERRSLPNSKRASLLRRIIALNMHHTRLHGQFRSKNEIVDVYTDFYDGTDDLTLLSEDERYDSVNRGFNRSVQLIDVKEGDGGTEREVIRGQYQNIGEAEFCVALYGYMLSQGYVQDQVLILTVYKAQKLLIEEVLDVKLGIKANVLTIAESEGRENDYIIFSSVRSKYSPHTGITRNSLISAFSRARFGMYCFCRKDAVLPLLRSRVPVDDGIELLTNENRPDNRSNKGEGDEEVVVVSSPNELFKMFN